VQAGAAVDGAAARLDGIQLVRRHQVHLVQYDHVGKGHLLLGLVAVLQPGQQVLGVHHGHDGVEHGVLLHALVHEVCLRHGGGVGEARRLDDDAVELVLAPHQPGDDADQAAAHGAAERRFAKLEATIEVEGTCPSCQLESHNLR